MLVRAVFMPVAFALSNNKHQENNNNNNTAPIQSSSSELVHVAPSMAHRQFAKIERHQTCSACLSNRVRTRAGALLFDVPYRTSTGSNNMGSLALA